MGTAPRWHWYDDARTAVLGEVLRAVVAGLVAETGRSRLDIVDAGGGTGGSAGPLAGQGHTVTVIDPSPDSLAAAQRRAAEMRVQLRAGQGDLGGLAALIGDPGAGQGIRVFTGLVPGSFAGVDPGAADALLARGQAAAAHPAFHDFAAQFHVLGYR